MKKIIVNSLRSLLHDLAQLTIWRYRPAVVGVTGSVGKTSTKLAIAAVLASSRRVRASHGNLNNDLGMPLTILGDWSEEELLLVSRSQPAGTAKLKKLKFWLKVIATSAWRLVFMDKERYPQVLVLEYGADRPGDIQYLLTIARPNVSVITAVGDVPVHVEFYNGPEEVAREKSRLIQYLPSAGYAVLNYDDETVINLKERTRAHVMTFGFEKDADMHVTRFENRVVEEKPSGVSFKIEYGGNFVPVRIESALGKSQGYAAAAAAAVGVIFGLNLVNISEALASYKPPQHRMELIPGIKYSYIIDDSYNASPLSMQAAFEATKDLPATRRIGVLGDMLEIGKYSVEAHESLGQMAGKIFDALFVVGPRAKFIAEEAAKAKKLKKNIFTFDTAEEAAKPLQDFIKKGDLVLVKGSHAMELEKVVEEIKIPEVSP